MREKSRAYLDLTIGFCLAGSSVVVGKLIAVNLPIYIASAASLAVSLMVLIPFAIQEFRWGNKHQLQPNSSSQFIGTGSKESGNLSQNILQRRSLLFIALQALFGIFIFRIGLMNGLKMARAGEIGIVTCCAPAVTAILSSILLKERLARKTKVGVSLAVLGLALIGMFGSDELNSNAHSAGHGSQRIFGLSLAFAAAVSESIFNVLSKKTANSSGPYLTSALVSGIALLLFAPFAIRDILVYGVFAQPVQLIYIGYYGVFVTAIAYVFWYRGVARVPASIAGMFSGIIPLSALFLSWLVLKESPSLGALWGGGILTVGIVLASTRTSRNN